MLNLKNLITELDEQDYTKLLNRFDSSNAAKYRTLLKIYRSDTDDEKNIIKDLALSNIAFNTLKSRLYGKVQEYLLTKALSNKTDLVQEVISIPNLIFNTNRDTATAVLKKLEQSYLEMDMPGALMGVYNALRSINLYSDKYYEFTKLYNRHVAYTIAHDKAESHLSEFTVILGQYRMSHDQTMPAKLLLYREEVKNISHLYDSHHLKIYKIIMDVSIALFLPLPNAVKDDAPVEDALRDAESVISSHCKDSSAMDTVKPDTSYFFLQNIISYLWFEYYHVHGVEKKAQQYLDKINNILPSFLLYNHCCFSSRFLYSKLEHHVACGTEEGLDEENNILFDGYRHDKNDLPGFINYTTYLAASAYFVNNYEKAGKLLNTLLNEAALLHYPHAEIETKLFLALIYSLQNKYELGWNILTSVTRKIAAMGKDNSYGNASVFVRILKTQATQKKNVKEKLMRLKNNFELHNKGENKLMTFVKLDDKLIDLIAKPVK